MGINLNNRRSVLIMSELARNTYEAAYLKSNVDFKSQRNSIRFWILDELMD